MKKQVIKLSICLTMATAMANHSSAQGWQAMPLNKLIAINQFDNTQGTATGNNQVNDIHLGIGTDIPDLSYKAQIFSNTRDSHLGLAGMAPSIRWSNLVNWVGSGNQADIGLATNLGDFVGTAIPGDFIMQNRQNSSLIFGAGGGTGVERMRIQGNGNVGINTPIVNDRLEINLGTLPQEYVRVDNMPTLDTNVVTIDPATGRLYRSSISLNNLGGNNSWLLTGNSTFPATYFMGSIPAMDVPFRSNNIERMRITAGGTIGIGTATPDASYKEEIYSTKDDNHLAIAGTAPSIRFHDNLLWASSTRRADLGLATAPGDYVPTSVGGDFVIQNREKSNLIFGCGGVAGEERMRIDKDGNVAINTTVANDRVDINLGTSPQEYVRIENMDMGEYNIVTIDPATGRLYMSCNQTKPCPSPFAAKVSSPEELQAQIKTLNEELATLKAKLNDISSKTDGAINTTGNTLFQNTPNPFNKETTIGYQINQMNGTASIMIADMNGREVSKFPIAQAGKGNIVVPVGNMNAGMYLYTLIVDGNAVDTKKMIVNAQ